MLVQVTRASGRTVRTEREDMPAEHTQTGLRAATFVPWQRSSGPYLLPAVASSTMASRNSVLA